LFIFIVGQSSPSFLAAIAYLFMLILLLARIRLITNLPIFDIFILYGVTSTRILIFLDHLSGFVSLSINGGFSSHSLLFAVLVHWLLADGFSHTTAHSEAARLETAESTTASHIAAAHHHSASHTTKSWVAEEIIIVVESAHHAEITHISKWIPPLFRAFLLLMLLIHLMTSHLMSTESHSHLRETATKEVFILVVKEVGKRIITTEKVPEYLISALHIEMVESLTSTCSERSKLMIGSTWTRSGLLSSVFNVIASIIIIVLPLLGIT
jgi:hypothetical protein